MTKWTEEQKEALVTLLHRNAQFAQDSGKLTQADQINSMIHTVTCEDVVTPPKHPGQEAFDDMFRDTPFGQFFEGKV